MKLCQVCALLDEDDARHTCRGCGCADWAAVAEPESPVDPEPAPEPAAAPRARRGAASR